jgi:hypothetical protein
MMLMCTLNAQLARLDGEIAKFQAIHLKAFAEGNQSEAESSLARLRALESHRRLLTDPEFFFPYDDL